jgi:hypothetical protein
MRASDTDRQRAIDELRRHCAAGRLDVEEYAARLDKAMVATTLEALDELLKDLPMVRIADPAGALNGGSRRDSEAAGDQSTVGLTKRLAASAVVLLTVMVVLAAIVLSLVASWAWVFVLLAGWVAGLVQGSLFSKKPGS